MSENESDDPFDKLQQLLLEIVGELKSHHQVLTDLVARVERIEQTLADNSKE